MDYTIRKTEDKDRKEVIDIFNYYIGNSFAAFFEKKVNLDFFETLKKIACADSFYVVEDKDRQIVGFGILKKFHDSEVFKGTAELGYFIRPEFTHKGIGTLVLDRLTTDARNMKIRILLASISSLNEESINFHKKHGFFECGRFKSIGQKYGKIFDIVWMQKFIEGT